MPVTSSHTVSYKSDYSLHHKYPHYLHLRWGWTFILCGMLNGCICHKGIAVHRLFGKCSEQNYQKMHKTVSNSSRNVHIYLRRFDWSMPPNCLKPKWVLIINYSNVEFFVSSNICENELLAQRWVGVLLLPLIQMCSQCVMITTRSNVFTLHLVVHQCRQNSSSAIIHIIDKYLPFQ